jgi:hypothetical protein
MAASRAGGRAITRRRPTGTALRQKRAAASASASIRSGAGTRSRIARSAAGEKAAGW